MLVKSKTDQSKSGCSKKRFRFLAKMTRCTESSPYTRMDSDAKESAKKSKKNKEGRKAEEFSKGKENMSLANKEVKEKKGKKKGWKRVGHVALTTCRYIGMGAAHLNPAAAYSSPDYYMDPKNWNKSFSSSYKPKVQQQTPHWTATMMFAGW